MAERITRLAPSPTGALHLGNIRTFVLNALLARVHGWGMRMRIEDLESPRVKAGATEAMLDELSWLGLSWSEPIVYQSRRAKAYRAALEQLIDAGLAYPCTCSRKDVAQVAAPHRSDGLVRYGGACRGRYRSGQAARQAAGQDPAWRVRTDDEPISFDDAFAGGKTYDLDALCGDFVIYTRSGEAAYQLAVVVDDAQAGVNEIVRADDLLDSAARQIYLRRLLGLGPEPRYWHLPLVIGPDGRRLAKRHGDTRLAHYRQAGAPPERVLGLMGYWCGLLARRREATMDELARRFDLDRIPPEPVVFTAADDAFLTGR